MESGGDAFETRRATSTLVQSPKLKRNPSLFPGVIHFQHYDRLTHKQTQLAENDKHETTFRDINRQLYKANNSRIKNCRPNLEPDTVWPCCRPPCCVPHLLQNDDDASWLYGILITSVTWEKHLTSTLKVPRRLLAAERLFSFAEVFVAARQEFLG